MADPSRLFLPFSQDALEPVSGALLIRPPADIPDTLSDPLCEQGFKPASDQLSARGFRVTPKADGRFPMVLVTLTRARAENLANIARAAQMSDGWVVVSGDKTDGVDATLKAVKKRTEIVGSIAKSHGKVFWFNGLDAMDWITAGEMSRNEDGYLTCAGIFSADRIDRGSALLLDHLPKPLAGKVADLGAGWGYLSVELLNRNADITQLDLYEAEYLALEAARLNVSDARAAFHWVDVSTLPKNPDYDAVVMNPPFHHSRSADPQIGSGFIEASARLLKGSGVLYMVANRQLPYEKTLDQTFRRWEILHQDGIYKLIVARRPKT